MYLATTFFPRIRKRSPVVQEEEILEYYLDR